MARNVALLLVPMIALGLYSNWDRERHFPEKELSNFERRYFEPIASRNYRNLPSPKNHGRHVLMLVPARWHKDRKTGFHSEQSLLSSSLQAKSFAQADMIFYIHEGEKRVDERYTNSENKVKMVKVRLPFVEMLAFDRSGKCHGFVHAYAEKPTSAIVFTKVGDTAAPEILANFSFSPAKWINAMDGPK